VNTKGIQQPNTVNSAAAGPMDRNARCRKCKIAPCGCDGDFLIIEMAYLVYNLFVMDRILKILNSVCPHCVRVLLDEESITEAWKERDPTERLKWIAKACVRMKKCDFAKTRRKKPVKLPELAADATEEQKAERELKIKELERQELIENDLKRIRLAQTGCCGKDL
jgi:DNA-directed RNA polymerase beta' subunit